MNERNDDESWWMKWIMTNLDKWNEWWWILMKEMNDDESWFIKYILMNEMNDDEWNESWLMK